MKKMLSFFAAALTAAAVTAPMSANCANIEPYEPNHIKTELLNYADDAKKAELIKGFSPVENVHLFDNMAHSKLESYDFDEMYVNEDYTKFIGFFISKENATYFKVKEVSSAEDIENDINEKLGSSYKVVPCSNSGYWFQIDSLSPAESMKICDSLKAIDIITDCGIKQDRLAYKEFYIYWGLNAYKSDTNTIDGRFVTTEEEMKPYVEKELQGYSLSTERINPGNNLFCMLIPPEGTTNEEMLRTAEKVYEDTGRSIAAVTTYSVASPKVLDQNSTMKFDIDVLNAVKGDANTDGSASIADAVAILQHLGNRDKYALSAQGEFNGDITGDFDGITASDALEIQRLDSKGDI